MKGRMVDLAIGMDGKQRITISVEGDLRGTFDELHESDISVEIKKFRKKRSLDANAYAWVLIDKLAPVLRMSKEEIYRETIRNIGGVSETVCVKNEAVNRLCFGWARNGLGWFTETFPSKLDGCTNVILYYAAKQADGWTYSNPHLSCGISDKFHCCSSHYGRCISDQPRWRSYTGLAENERL